MTPFAELVRASAARLDAAARLILRDRELAGDAVQEAYIRAWRNLPGLRDPDRFDGWLHRLLVRSCIDTVRRRGARPIEVELHPLAGPAIHDPALDVVVIAIAPGSDHVIRDAAAVRGGSSRSLACGHRSGTFG